MMPSAVNLIRSLLPAVVAALSFCGVAFAFTALQFDAEVSPGPHVYEIELASPCPLRDLYLGGNPAIPMWHRGWNGSVREVIFVSPSATAADAAVIRAYLSKRWGTGRYRSGVADERATLHSLGIRTGGVYGSALILR